MPSAEDHSAMRRIAELATKANAQPDVPASVRPILDEILRLADATVGDTPEPSDLPQTENQSL